MMIECCEYAKYQIGKILSAKNINYHDSSSTLPYSLSIYPLTEPKFPDSNRRIPLNSSPF